MENAFNESFNQWVLWCITKFRYVLFNNYIIQRTSGITNGLITLPWWYNNEKKEITSITFGWMLLMFLSLQSSCHFQYVVLYLFLVVVLHKVKIISFAESGMSCVLMRCSIKGMQLALVLGTVDVLLFVPSNCRCWLLNVIGVFITFRRIIGNQLCVLHNGVISSALDDSFLIFDSVFQIKLNGRKQYI